MSSAPYNPPDYLVASTGLTAAQLKSQFEVFKSTLHFASAAPELIFERVVANVLSLTTLPASPGMNHDLQESIEDLQNEIATLNNNLREIRGIELSKAFQPQQTLHGPSPPRATPIKFFFVLGPHGLSTRAEPYHSYDGLYGAGCLWSDLKLVDSLVQFGTYNSIEDDKSEPKDSQWGATIKFPRPFREVPEVVAWLTGVDMRCDRPCHVNLAVSEVSESEFEVYITSSEDNVWYSLGLSWVAWPAGKSRYSYSRFDMVLYGTSTKPGIFGSKFHDLPQSSAAPVKTVLAVSKLAMGCGGTMPFFLTQAYPVKDDHLFCELMTSKTATGMYMLDVVCIVCGSV
ncbi:hypothetical protein Q9L58_001481 [Maublancomyces gigas]|uniref:H-type lectin domain-containing protein n=1 Tax=Discina gigas TaxID=1032678 RepID=A0ABR3GUC4_9PEZI